MAYEQRKNSGRAFISDKRASESHPHFKGTALIGGVEYWHSIWKKKTKDGATWLSSSFLVKEATAGQYRDARDGAPAGKPPTAGDDLDDVPF